MSKMEGDLYFLAMGTECQICGKLRMTGSSFFFGSGPSWGFIWLQMRGLENMKKALGILYGVGPDWQPG